MLTLRHAGAAHGGSADVGRAGHQRPHDEFPRGDRTERNGAGAVRLRENRYARLAALEEWKTALGRNLRVENFLDAAKTSVAVAGYATEVEMLVGTLGLRKSP